MDLEATGGAEACDDGFKKTDRMKHRRDRVCYEQIRGTPDFRPAAKQFRLRSTPATPSNTATAPSSTRKERSTSMVKSTVRACR